MAPSQCAAAVEQYSLHSAVGAEASAGVARSALGVSVAASAPGVEGLHAASATSETSEQNERVMCRVFMAAKGAPTANGRE